MSYCETDVRLEYNQLFDDFLLGCKKEQQIGMEYERLSINSNNNEVVSYSGEYGISELLREFAKVDNWDYLLDDVNIIGLKKLHDTITLEPGGQLELSISPKKKISEIKQTIEDIDNEMKPILNRFGITLLNKGVSPKTTYKNIKLIPKRRYKVMSNYLWGILSDVMMKETAGIQVSVDFSSEVDCMRKYRVANLMMPFMTAMCANSKYRGGVDTGYKSFRALAWLNTDNERCGFATQFKDGMSFKDYVNILLDTPMIYIMRDEKAICINGKITFREFLQKGYESFIPLIEDWELHANLFFPEVRLRNYIEIRNHDCVNGGLEYSIPAFYKGIMYNPNAIEAVEKILLKYNYNEMNELRYNIAKYAIQAKLRGKAISNICNELVQISYNSLKMKGEDEEKFLEPLVDLLKQNKIPAEI